MQIMQKLLIPYISDFASLPHRIPAKRRVGLFEQHGREQEKEARLPLSLATLPTHAGRPRLPAGSSQGCPSCGITRRQRLPRPRLQPRRAAPWGAAAAAPPPPPTRARPQPAPPPPRPHPAPRLTAQLRSAPRRSAARPRLRRPARRSPARRRPRAAGRRDRLRRRCLLPGEERGPALTPRNPFGAAAVGSPRSALQRAVGMCGDRRKEPCRRERDGGHSRSRRGVPAARRRRATRRGRAAGGDSPQRRDFPRHKIKFICSAPSRTNCHPSLKAFTGTKLSRYVQKVESPWDIRG